MGSAFRASPRDAWVVAASLGWAVALVACGALAHARPALGLGPAALGMALGVWWGSNTLCHIHLHGGIFRARVANHLWSLWLTLLSGVPQSIWRARHLRHHGGAPQQLEASLCAEGALLALFAGSLGSAVPWALVAWFSGLALGLGLCHLQGRFEHERAGRGVPLGVSTYGALYNRLCFNDGFHAEHHRWPGIHWTELPGHRLAEAISDTRPPLWRALHRPVPALLGWLEGLCFGRPWLQQRVVARHRDAIATLGAAIGPVHHAAVVGGGLFPRTAICLAAQWPSATMTLIDASPAHLERARQELARRDLLRGVAFVAGRFDPGSADAFDLVVIPLAYEGDREALYRATSGPPLLIHDWIWRRRGARSTVVSWLLLKRLNLVAPQIPAARDGIERSCDYSASCAPHG